MVEIIERLFHFFEDPFVLNVTASVVGALVVYILVAVFNIRIPPLSVLFFWAGYSRELVIVISEVTVKYDPTYRPGKQPQLTPIGDAIVLADFLHYFREKLGKTPKVLSVHNISEFDAIKDQNMLLIGGPKYNIACNQFLTEIDNELEYQFKRIRVPSERRRANDPELKMLVSRAGQDKDFICDGSNECDYGMVVVRQNPYAKNKTIITVGGLSPMSTIAAANWIRRASFIKWLIKVKLSNGFQAILRCRAVDTVRVSNINLVHSQVIERDENGN